MPVRYAHVAAVGLSVASALVLPSWASARCLPFITARGVVAGARRYWGSTLVPSVRFKCLAHRPYILQMKSSRADCRLSPQPKFVSDRVGPSVDL